MTHLDVHSPKARIFLPEGNVGQKLQLSGLLYVKLKMQDAQ